MIQNKIFQFSKSNMYNSLEIGPGNGMFSKDFRAWRLNFFVDLLITSYEGNVERRIRKKFPGLHQKYLKFYAREHGLSSIALRYSNVYGPRQNPHGEAGVVAIFCNQFLDRHPARINGDGKYIRDYVYGPDVAAANLSALSLDEQAFGKGKMLSLNIGTGLALTSIHSKRTCEDK